MDYAQEINFIQAFVRRDRRERSEFELRSPKQRAVFLNRLCHSYKTILDPRYLKPLPLPNSDHQFIVRYLAQKQAPSTCYVISAVSELDGQHVSLVDALAKIVGFGLPSIVICRPGILGYFEAEQEDGPPPRYVLERT